MYSCKALSAATEATFAAQAWAAHLEALNNDYESLMAMVTDAATVDLDDVDDNPDGLTIDQYVQQLCEEKGFSPQMVVSMPNGYTTIRDLCVVAHNKIEQYADIASVNPSLSVITGKHVSLWDKNHENILHDAISLQEAFDFMKDSLESSVVMQAAVEAASYGQDVLTRLQVYKDKVATIFDESRSKISHIFQWGYKILSSSANTVADVVTNIRDIISGVERNDSTYIANTNVYEFTGVSPEAVLDFGFAKQVASATGRILATAVHGAYTLISNVLKQAYSEIAGRITEISQGYDVTISNSRASGYGFIDWIAEEKFGHSASTDWSTFFTADGGLTPDQQTDLAKRFRSIYGRWFKFKTLFGEILAKSNLTPSVSNITKSEFTVLWNNSQVKYKPYFVNPFAIKRCCDALWPSPDSNTPLSLSMTTFTDSSYVVDVISQCDVTAHISTAYDDSWAALMELIAKQDDLYFTGGLEGRIPERTLMAGLRLSWVIQQLLFWQANYSLRGIVSPLTKSTSIVTENSETNVLFLRTATGFSNNSFDLQNIPNILTADATTYAADNGTGFGSFAWRVFDTIFLQFCDRAASPLDWAFVPYQNGTQDFDPQMYHLRSDAENQKIWTNFLTTTTVVAVGVLIAVSIGVAVRAIARKRFWKRQQFLSQMDSKMWSETDNILSRSEKRKYIRYSRKQNACSLLTSGLAGSFAGSLTSSSSGISDFVSNLLCGNNNGEKADGLLSDSDVIKEACTTNIPGDINDIAVLIRGD